MDHLCELGESCFPPCGGLLAPHGWARVSADYRGVKRYGAVLYYRLSSCGPSGNPASGGPGPGRIRPWREQLGGALNGGARLCLGFQMPQGIGRGVSAHIIGCG